MKRNKLIVSIMLLGMITPTYDLFSGKVAPEPKLQGLRLATFDIDVTPPVGYEMAFDYVINTWDLGLRAKGFVLLGAGQPGTMTILWLCLAFMPHTRKATIGPAYPIRIFQ